MIQLLCFDLDGTLVDSARDISNAVNRTLVEFGKPPLAHEVVVSHIGEGLRVLIEGVFQVLPEGHTASMVMDRFLRIYEEEMLNTTRIFEGVTEFLDDWTRDGGQISIITNKNEAPARRLVEHLGLHRFPWLDIFGADTLAERKPSPLPLRTMMKKAGVTTTQTLMIGDGTPDIASANAAQVRSVAIHFGYTKPEILCRHRPTAALSHYNDLKEVIRSLKG